VAAGEIRRLMVFMPPRHSKSETVSRLFTAYFLSLHPERWVGVTSYAAELAYTLSRSARDNYLTSGGQIRDDAGAVKHWQTPQGGGLWAAGVGGPITGKGFHLGIIDDPLKNAEEAASELIREKQWEWYQSTFYTREEPEGAIVLIQTRWNEDDLSGRALAEELSEDGHPEGWHIVDCAALAEKDRQAFPATCTVEPDPRRPGEALCPERYPAERLERIKSRIGPYFFGALFQQRPTVKEGSFFKVTQFQFLDVAPVGMREVRAWDLAATEGAGDWTSGVRMGTDALGRFIISDAHRGQWATDERDAEIKLTANSDGTTVRQHFPQDPGQAGKSQAKAMVRLVAGVPVSSDLASGKKEVRADPYSSQVNAGNVYLVRGTWNKPFIEVHRQFPNGAHDDDVDAAADAFNLLTQKQEVTLRFR
jgi:predicted phage terminase large subunit-like protein